MCSVYGSKLGRGAVGFKTTCGKWQYFISVQQCPKTIGVSLCKGNPCPIFLHGRQKRGSNGWVWATFVTVSFCSYLLLVLPLVVYGARVWIQENYIVIYHCCILFAPVPSQEI